MPFSLGSYEVLVVLATLIPTLAWLAARGYSSARWLVAGSISVTVAAVITPADLLTTIILSIVFFGLLALGSRMGLVDAPASR